MGSSPKVSAKKADTKSPAQTNANAEPPAAAGKSISSILAVAVAVDATGEGRTSLTLFLDFPLARPTWRSGKG
jgi:hypothetical protein